MYSQDNIARIDNYIRKARNYKRVARMVHSKPNCRPKAILFVQDNPDDRYVSASDAGSYKYQIDTAV